MISRGLRLLTKLIRISFCEKKPIGIPEEEWKNAKLFAVTGDYATTGNEDLFFNTLEQQLSLKLLQTKNDKQVIELLKIQKPEDLTPDILFLFLYSYAKFSSPTNGQMRNHLQKVLMEQDLLDNTSLIKLYEMIVSFKDKIKLTMPKVRKMDVENMVEFVYLLSQLFSETQMSPWLQSIDKQSADQNQSAMLQLVRRYPKNHRLQQLTEQSLNDCEDGMQLAKIAIIYLQTAQKNKARSAISKIKPIELQANSFVDLLFRLIDQKDFQPQWEKLIPQLQSTDLREVSQSTFVNLWAMVAKIKNIDVRNDIVDRLTHIDDLEHVSLQDLTSADRFTIVITSAFLNIPQKQFVKLVLDGIKVEELSADNVFFLMMGCRKMKFQNYDEAFKMEVLKRESELQPKFLALFKKQPK